MSWKEVDKMLLKKEFVQLALNEDANISSLCKSYGISRTLGYELLKRYSEEGAEGLKERSRRPNNSPTKTSEEIEREILKVRDRHYSWGGRKIYHYLINQGVVDIPHPSTITDILRRHNRLYEWSKNEPKKPYHRFVKDEPNELWQMDFKGHFPLIAERCYPLTIIDDCSRFVLAIEACIRETKIIVKEKLINVFRRYGLPLQINMDNGKPWGTCGMKSYSELAIWMMRLGIRVSYSSLGHPQTNGKDERFHKSLKQDVINRYTIRTIKESQKYFDNYREIYNCERPHEAIGYDVPAKHYQKSKRIYPEKLPSIEYLDDDNVYKVNHVNGCIIFKDRQLYVGKAFMGEPVAIRATKIDGVYNIFYCQQKIKNVDFRIVKKV